jgi:di/tricarboxylate transporter
MPFADPRAFTAEFIVQAGGPLDGARLGDVVVPEIGGLHPVEIAREGGVVPVPRADELLRAGDRLVVAAGAADILAVNRFAGLVAAGEHTFVRDPAAKRRVLVELVIAHRCPLVGTTVGDGSFRRHYDAAVIALARQGERVERRVEGWTLAAGDAVLVEASADFLALHRTNPDFYVVSSHGTTQSAPRWHRQLSVVIFVAMVLAAASGLVPRFQAFLAATLLLIGSGVIGWNDAKDDVSWRVMLTIALSLGLGKAMQDSGAAAGVAGGLVALGAEHPWLSLGMVSLATV